jgi:hypothetical protein
MAYSFLSLTWRRVAGCAAIGLSALAAHAAQPAQPSVPVVDDVGVPKFSRGESAQPHPGARTIPYFSFTATDGSNNASYNLTMVGAAPSLAAGSTTIATEIVPIRLHFANGAVLDGSTRAAAVAASPVFSANTYPANMSGGDTGQYGDVFMRSQFNLNSSGYHLLLASPVVFPTVAIDVPANQGTAVRSSRSGALIGLVDSVWFSSQLQNLLGQLHIDAATLPIFLTDNAMLYDGNNTSNCCTIGYHGAHGVAGNGGGSANSNGAAVIQTFIFAAYSTPGTFRSEGIQDIHALSHEVAEWLDDPFVNNVVQPWLTPTAPQYGCTSYLETGDPVVGIWFPLTGNSFSAGPFNPNGYWHPEDEVYWNWFLRRNPSSSYGGNYTFMGSLNPYPGFKVPATGC